MASGENVTFFFELVGEDDGIPEEVTPLASSALELPKPVISLAPVISPSSVKHNASQEIDYDKAKCMIGITTFG